MADYEELRQQHIKDAYALLPEYQERLSWSAERLAQEREKDLRALVSTAKEKSPWHKERLAHIDPATLTEADLARIPPMTKADLMNDWDEIVTDRRLNLDLVNSHLEGLDTDQYLLDSFHAVASGGSTGRRGVFVYDWQGWTRYFIILARQALLDPVDMAEGETPVIAQVAASKATHVSGAVPQTFSNPDFFVHRFPINLPIKEIVAGLNAVQPDVFSGYPSALYVLANEARAGRLHIAPKKITTYAEPLLPEIRAAAKEVWGVSVGNLWASSEGGCAFSCSQGSGMHLSDDSYIVELVDAEGHPVPAGVRSAKIYLTNLFNHTLPLIRYEITDEMTVMDKPCPCGSAHRRIEEVMGRLDDIFTYGNDIQIHPHVFRSALGHERHIVEYQVRQTPRGAEVSFVGTGAVDMEGLRAKIAGELATLGLEDADLSIAQVDGFERLETGKLKRFIPLA